MLKATFKTNKGLFKRTVMVFGLTNSPATFIRMRNEVLKSYLNSFVIMYLDNIIVFSNT